MALALLLLKVCYFLPLIRDTFLICAYGNNLGGFTNIDGLESFTVSLITERAVAIHDVAKLSAEQITEM